MTEDTHQASTDTPDVPDPSDLDKLPSLDEPGVGGSLAGEDATGDGDPSIHERQDPDHVGVDWDLTERTRD